MSGGPYNLRSRPTDPTSALPVDLSPEHFPPLSTSSPMATPSSTRDDVILEQLRALTTSMAAQSAALQQQSATLQQHSEKFDALASTDARVARLEELVTSLTTTRSGGESAVPTPAITRAPQV